MYAQFERHGDAVSCSVCGLLVVKSGISIGPLLNDDGSPYQGNGAAALWARCAAGHDTPVDLGARGRIHLQPNAPAVDYPGLIAR